MQNSKWDLPILHPWCGCWRVTQHSGIIKKNFSFFWGTEVNFSLNTPAELKNILQPSEGTFMTTDLILKLFATMIYTIQKRRWLWQKLKYLLFKSVFPHSSHNSRAGEGSAPSKHHVLITAGTDKHSTPLACLAHAADTSSPAAEKLLHVCSSLCASSK